MSFITVWRSLKTRSLILLVSLSWFTLVLLVFSVNTVFDKVPNDLPSNEMDSQYQKLNARLIEANNQIEVLMTQNKQLTQHLQIFSKVKKRRQDLFSSDSSLRLNIDSGLTLHTIPDTDFEQSLRRLKQNTEEIWHYLRPKLNENSITFANELRYNMAFDLDVITGRDSRWRVQELNNLTDFVQKRIQRLQNPSDCMTAKKLFCDLNKYCGFGCQIHHLAHCLVASMALNRTLIVQTNKWRTGSTGEDVWNKVFQPISQTCTDSGGSNHTHWSEDPLLNTYQVIHYPIIDFISPVPPFLPLVIPTQISESIIKLSGEPFVWFIGQVLKYLLRPSLQMSEYIEEFKRKNHFKHPIVGIHVRRTDKIGTEANFHPIHEYMGFVDDFYNKIDLKNERNLINKKTERLVYLATDEPKVWKSEITPFKDQGYVFTGDIQLSESAGPSQRHEFESLKNVVIDIVLLSQCDYIVCTFSSQICRLAFELMQTRISSQDMSTAYYTLDDIYYFGGQVFHGKKALVSHVPQNDGELSFKAGDIVGVANDLHDGYNKGDHSRTKSKGRYPRFKVTEFVESKPFAIFD